MAQSMLRDFIDSNESRDEDLKDKPTEKSGDAAPSKDMTDQGGAEKSEVKDQAEGGSAETSAVVRDPKETHKDGEASKRDVEVAEKIESSVESLIATTKVALEEGGLGDREVELLGHAVESLSREMGVSRESVVALEGFSEQGSDFDRKNATQLAMESLEESLVRIHNTVEKMREKVDGRAK